MKKILTIILSITMVAVATCGVIKYRANAAMDVADEVADNTKDLATAIVSAASTKEIVNVTNVEVKHELQEIGEISTYELKYEDTDEINSHKEKIGVKLPGSTYQINIAYKGTVKAGYDFEEVEVTVDNENKEITVKLPEAKIIQSGVDNKSLKITEKTSFISKAINPIGADTVSNRIKLIENQELDKAINQDEIKTKARESAEQLIKEVLTSFEYEVVFEG